MQKALRSDVDPDGLLEFSVVYTDRALNHMSAQFKTIIQELSQGLKSVYHADAIALIPGGGTYAMESVARQLATNQKVLVVRNGFFSFRWSQILEQGNITKDITVLNAIATENSATPAYAPMPIDQVVQAIHAQKPQVVFAPHVETASGIVLPDDYIAQLAKATHEVGGLLVIDCIASGCVWLNMQDLGIDVLLSAPQKGWSSTPCAGIVALNARAVLAVQNSTSSSFAMDLKTWLNIIQAYENGGHAYHATMPTDSIKMLHSIFHECQTIGFDTLKSAQITLGKSVRDLLAQYGYKSVADAAYAAAGVVVCYTQDDALHKGSAFAQHGVQIAGGVPLKVGESADFKTFRLGLFGLDKLTDIPGTLNRLDTVLQQIQKT